ncbi:MAG: hypothetical protein K2P71_14425 [Lachnospiraceae bacterium]|jgi:ribonucleoside-triphosphate reductase|nr:hypothetical protein [Lachnospiraceae bacterium]
MFQVIKTNGETADFTLTKISDAIMKAFCEADMQYNYDQADLLALRVTADFQNRVEENGVPADVISDSVKRVLEQAGYAEAARAYLYRDMRKLSRNGGLR